MPSARSMDALSALVERANHLEVLIVSNLLGFLLTATFTVFAAVYELHSAGKAPPFATSQQIFIGISVLYVFLGGYYYFMLAQFYACIVTLVPFARSAGFKLDTLWTTLRIPSFGLIPKRTATIVMLANAPLLPLAFSILSLFAFRLLVNGNATHGVGIISMIVGLSLQVLTCIFMITQPFLEFIKGTTG
jgi:hypothetical protein